MQWSFACTISAALTLDVTGSSVTGSLVQELVSCTDAGQPIEIP
jgi:hypothetical protein